MSQRPWAHALATAVWATAVGIGLCGPIFAFASGEAPGDVWFAGLQGVIAIVYTSVGALIAARQPRNAVGWILLVVGACQGISGGVYSYGAWAAARGLPLAHESVWLANWIWAPSLALLATVLLLLFPDGRPLSPRWRVPLVIAGVATVAAPASFAIPAWGVRRLLLTTEEDLPLPPLSGTVFDVSALVIAGVAVLALLSVVLRFRRSVGLERAQMKWFAFGGAATALGTAATFTPGPSDGVLQVLWGAGLLAALVAAPVTVGVAVLRFRLYEIDRIVSRTVGYAVVTGVLVAVYAGAVVLFGRVLAPLTQESQVAVAGSTLLVAALFQPLRRRVQTVVDRRFNRARYDAHRTVALFAGRMRDAVDLEELRGALLAAVAETVEPATATVWLRRARG